MTVTQAQIEAARILCEVRRDEPCQRVEWNLDDKDCKICDFALLNSKQASALTAAAEVGDEYKPIYDSPNNRVRAAVAATIERCAQVVDERAKDIEAFTHQDNQSRFASEILRKLAARIRALKDS